MHDLCIEGGGGFRALENLLSSSNLGEAIFLFDFLVVCERPSNTPESGVGGRIESGRSSGLASGLGYSAPLIGRTDENTPHQDNTLRDG